MKGQLGIGGLIIRIGFLARALYKGYYKGSIRVLYYRGLNNYLYYFGGSLL